MKRLLRAALAVVVGLLISAVIFGVYAVRSTRVREIEGCRPYALFTKPKYSSHVVFIGRVVYVGGVGEIHNRFPDSGSWAVVKIKKRYWGVPVVNPGFAIATNGVFRPGQEYLFSGPKTGVRVLDWLLLTVDVAACKDTYRLKTAEPELRVLRDGAPRSGVRLLGYVRDECSRPIPFAKIIVKSADLSVSTTADSSGIYDVTVPLRREYTIRTEKDNDLDKSSRVGRYEETPALSEGSVWGRTVYVSDLNYVELSGKRREPCQEDER